MVKYQLKRLHKYILRYIPKKEGIVFLISLGVAFIFWILLVLDKTYTAAYPVDVGVINVPADKVLRYKLPEYVSVKVEAKGWDLLKLRRSKNKLSAQLNIDKYKDQKFVMLNSVHSFINDELLRQMHIKEINPDRINIQMDTYAQKKLAVKPVLDIQYKKEFGRSGPVTLNPQFINISGPASVVSEMDTLYTEVLKLRDVDKAVNEQLFIRGLQAKNLAADTHTVGLYIDVDRLTEASKTLSVKMYPDKDYQLKIIPERVNIVYQVPVSLYDEIDTTDFTVFINREEMRENRNKLKIHLKTHSEYIYYPRLSNTYVNFIYVE